MISVEEFRAEAEAWVAANQDTAPPDWGAIMPAERRDEGMEWQKRVHEAGFASVHWPGQYGGRDLTIEHHQAWAEVCQDAGVPHILNMVGLVLTGSAIQLFGTEVQKLAHLPPTIKGERVWCQLFSEPGAGSDLAGLSTRAELDGDTWVINGQKVWCSGGRASDWGILLARSEPDQPKHAGISFFLVDMKTPGIETRPLKQMTGSAEFDEVFFTDARLPSGALLGERGQGWTIAMSALTNERGHIGGMGRTLTKRLQAMVGLGAGLDPVQRDQLMQLYCRGRAFLAMSQRQGPTASVGSSLGKLAMTNFMFDIAEFRVGVAGAGATLVGEESNALVGAPGGWFGGGTAQVQRNIIGERILGLPREPKG